MEYFLFLIIYFFDHSGRRVIHHGEIALLSSVKSFRVHVFNIRVFVVPLLHYDHIYEWMNLYIKIMVT